MLTSLQEKIDPRHTALIVVDVQRPQGTATTYVAVDLTTGQARGVTKDQFDRLQPQSPRPFVFGTPQRDSPILNGTPAP